MRACIARARMTRLIVADRDTSVHDLVTFVNGYLLKHGYATVTLYPPNMKYATHLTALEREAKANGRGLWSHTKERVLTGTPPR